MKGILVRACAALLFASALLTASAAWAADIEKFAGRWMLDLKNERAPYISIHFDDNGKKGGGILYLDRKTADDYQVKFVAGRSARKY